MGNLYIGILNGIVPEKKKIINLLYNIAYICII